MPYLILIFLLLLPGCAKPPPPPEPLIDPRIIAAVIQVESAGNPRAIGRKKEIGLMQILPSTGRMLGYPSVRWLTQNLNLSKSKRTFPLSPQVFPT